MTVKTNGAELKRFYADPSYWSNGDGETWHEEEIITVNGVTTEDVAIEEIADDAIIQLSGGVVFSNQWDVDHAMSFETYFKRWRKEQTTATIIVEIAKDRLDVLTAAIDSAGGKIVK
jgi:hypothetical protein